MSGLEATFKVLCSSRTGAAEELWLEALSSPRGYIRSQTFQAAGKGSPTSIQVSIIERWRELAAEEKAVVEKNLVRFLPGLRECMCSPDDQLRANAFAMALSLRAYALIPDFVKLLEAPDLPFRASAGRILLRLAELVPRENRVTSEDNRSLTADFYRPQIVDCLTRSMRRFQQHQRPEILAAYLMVTPLDSTMLRELLGVPKSLPLTSAAGVLAGRDYVDISNQLLIDFLNDKKVPDLVMQLWATRTDPKFVSSFLAEIGQSNDPHGRRNLGKLESVDWLRDMEDWVEDLEVTQQRGLLNLATSCSERTHISRRVIEILLEKGHEALHVDCLRGLKTDESEEADQLVVGAFSHPNPAVQAEVVRQLQHRDVPGGEALLIQALDHPDVNVSRAAVESFSDYNVEDYLKSYETMDPITRSTKGKILKRVDSRLVPKLQTELTQEVRFRKLRALEIATDLELMEQIANELVELTESVDQGLRIEACSALGACTSLEAEVALNRAMTDKSLAVREAAMSSLGTLEAKRQLDATKTSLYEGPPNNKTEVAP